MNNEPQPEPTTSAVTEKDLPRKKRFSWLKLSGRTLVISIAVHLIFGMIAGYLVVQNYPHKRKDPFISMPKPASPDPRPRDFARASLTKSASAMMTRITVNGGTKVSLPPMPEIPSAGLGLAEIPGMGHGKNPSRGVPGGTPNRVRDDFPLPPILNNRCSPSARTAASKLNGGSQKSEEAVVKALKFLTSKQNADGSWGKQYKGAMTGFALLSYLGHCEIRNPDFAPAISKGIEAMTEFGSSHGGSLTMTTGESKEAPYQHGIATYALAEAFTMMKQTPTGAKIDPVLRQAVAIIVKGQKTDGSWAYGYSPSGNPDLSVAGWQIQALKAAHYSGVEMPGVDQALDRAINWLKTMQDPATGHFGYSNATDGNNAGAHRLTGVGVLAMQVWKTGSKRAATNGIRAILTDPPPLWDTPGANLYAWYYETQACMNAGGDAWRKWNKVFQEQVVSHQNADGSWPVLGGDKWKGGSLGTDALDGVVYRTALCTLMLEVYYRYLPSSKSAGGMGGGLDAPLRF